MYSLQINGRIHQVDAPADMPLLWVLRDIVKLTGTKYGCGIAMCGACTVHRDGRAVRSCVLPISEIGEDPITTVESIGNDTIGQTVQRAWLDLEVVQCGYCQSGQIMSAVALLRANAAPSDADIDTAMTGNICRCGTYARIRDAIKLAARQQPVSAKVLPLASTVAAGPGTAGPPAKDAPVGAPTSNKTPTESLNESATPKPR
jgi:isoquinoline 1-oxidoreductase alpha subunit